MILIQKKKKKHELKSVMAIADCRLEGIFVPLMAVIIYRGFSLIAQTLLPVDNSTLVYGTSDGGKNLHASNPVLNDKIKVMADMLNLKLHSIRCAYPHALPHLTFQSTDPSTNETFNFVRLYGPADLEGLFPILSLWYYWHRFHQDMLEETAAFTSSIVLVFSLLVPQNSRLSFFLSPLWSTNERTNERKKVVTLTQ